MRGIVIPTGEDESEELYSIILNDITFDYVIKNEIIEWIDTGKIRNVDTNITESLIFGQEMSNIKFDDQNNAYSIVEIEYEIKGSDISKGDTIYHNEIVPIDNNGYPYDGNYIFQKINTNSDVYGIIKI